MRCTRCGRPICPDCMVPASVGFQCPDDVREGARSVRQPRTTYGGQVTDRADVTRTLVGINVAVFAVTALGGGILLGGGTSSLYGDFALQPESVAQLGERYRLLTAMFLHFGVLHLALNMLALLQYGPLLEAALGRWRFAGLYLVSGIAGSAASYALGPAGGQAAGASGAVLGLLGATVLVLRRRGEDIGQLAGFVAVNLAVGALIPFIDLRAHLGGLVGGALVALALTVPARGPRRTLAQACGAAIVLLLALCAVELRTAALLG